jgi:hypothetical protein
MSRNEICKIVFLGGLRNSFYAKKCCKKQSYKNPTRTEKNYWTFLKCPYILVKMDYKKNEKNEYKYSCVDCDYKCYYKSDYERHVNTIKHKRITLDYKNAYYCNCGKKYTHRQGLSKHKRYCNVTEDKKTIQDIQSLLLIQQQQQQQRDEEHKEEQRQRDENTKKEHQQQIQDLTDRISNISIVTNNTTNNKFNLNFFLNNQCKDAIDFQTFLKQIKIDEEDLYYFGNHGYLNGMMNIIDKSLGSLELHERPIHCTDVKRQIMYFKKEDGTWEKDKEKLQMNRLISTIDNKSYYRLEDWEEGKKYKYEDMDSPNFKWYLKVATETMGGDYSKDDIHLSKMLNYLAIEFYIKKGKQISIA